jgi:acyl carrier protein
MKEKLFELISMKLGIGTDQISMQSEFINDLGADSLDTVEIIMEIEDVFDIEIPDHESEKMFTVASVYNYLQANTNDPNI